MSDTSDQEQEYPSDYHDFPPMTKQHILDQIKELQWHINDNLKNMRECRLRIAKREESTYLEDDIEFMWILEWGKERYAGMMKDLRDIQKKNNWY